jgi:hypothetical protein
VASSSIYFLDLSAPVVVAGVAAGVGEVVTLDAAADFVVVKDFALFVKASTATVIF